MTNPIQTMFAALAKTHAGSGAGLAYSLVVECMEMELIPIEVAAQIVIGQLKLADALRQAADVVADMSESCGDDVEHEALLLAGKMRSAALTFDSLGQIAG